MKHSGPSAQFLLNLHKIISATSSNLASGRKKKELTGATDLAGILSCRIAGGTKGAGLDLLVGSLCVFATLAEDAYVANGTIVAALTDGVGYFFVVGAGGAGGGFFGGHAAHCGGGG